MLTVYELTYSQHVKLANSEDTTEITAGYVRERDRAEEWARQPGNSMHEVKMSQDDFWMVSED